MRTDTDMQYQKNVYHKKTRNYADFEIKIQQRRKYIINKNIHVIIIFLKGGPNGRGAFVPVTLPRACVSL